MEEKKNKICLSTIFLIIAVIIIIILGVSLYNLNNELEDMVISQNQEDYYEDENYDEEDSNIIDIDTNIDTENTIENNTENEPNSFSEIMDKLYTKNNLEINENTYNPILSERIYMISEDTSGNTTDVEHTYVTVYNDGIYINMRKTGDEKNLSTKISGIIEEVVSIKIIQKEAEGIPSVVYFLTRNGNVYYINEEMINSNKFVAKKLTNLKEIISIEIVDVLYSGAMHGDTTALATTYSGEKIDLINEINN